MKKLSLFIFFIIFILTVGLTACEDTNKPSKTDNPKTYIICFDNTGGTGGQAVDITVTFGEPMPLITDVPSKKGCYFNGYWDMQNGGVKYYNADGSSAKNWDKNEGIMLFAQWSPIQYIITFNANDGWGGQTETVNAAFGDPLPVLSVPAPVNEDYNALKTYEWFGTKTARGYVKKYFDGYWDAKDGGKKYYNEDMNSISVWDKTEDAVLYARWLSAEEKYNFTFTMASGTGNNLGVRNDTDDFVAYFVETPPIIDGVGNDPAWEKAMWQPLNYQWMWNNPLSEVRDAPDFSGRFKVLWDENYLYILVEITDDILSATRTNPYDNAHNDDCLEFFIDENASGGTRGTGSVNPEPGVNNFFTHHISYRNQSTFDYIAGTNNTATTDVTLRIENGGILRNSHLNYVVNSDDAPLYIWECRLNVYNDSYPVRATPVADPPNTRATLTEGKKIGFAVAYCDNDVSDHRSTNTANRDHFIGSMYVTGNNDEARNQSYLNSTQYGKMYLVK